MTKITCVLLSLVLLALGIIGVTGFIIDMTYVNIGVIIIGAIGLLTGIYAKQRVSDQRLITETATQKRDIEHQKEDIEQQKKEIEQQRKEIEQQRKEIEQQKKEIEQEKNKN